MSHMQCVINDQIVSSTKSFEVRPPPRETINTLGKKADYDCNV